MDLVCSDINMFRDLPKKVVYGKNGKRRKRILLLLPGGMAGVWQAGLIHAWADRGITANSFDVISANSCGSYNGWAYILEMAHLIRGVYENLGWAPLVNLAALLREMGLERDHRLPIPKFLVGISELSGKYHLRDAATAKSVVMLCTASASLFYPMLYESMIVMDGGLVDSFPLWSTMAKADVEEAECDVFVVGSRTRPRHFPRWDAPAFDFYRHAWLPWVTWSWSLTRSSASLDDKIEQSISVASAPPEGMRIGFMFPSEGEGIHSLDVRSWAVRDCGKVGYESGARLAEMHCQ